MRIQIKLGSNDVMVDDLKLSAHPFQVDS